MPKEQQKYGLVITFQEQMVGLFIVLALGLALGVLVFIGRGQHWFAEKVTYYTYFDEGYNLKPGAQVKLFNTWVGNVKWVELTEDNRVKVTLQVFEDYSSKLREDSVATVDSPTIIGSEFIALTPGSQDKPALPEEGVIKSKAKKKIGEYLEEYQVEQKIKDFGEIISSLKEVVEQLKDPEGPLFSILRDVQRIMDKVTEGKGNLGKLVMEERLYREVTDSVEDLKVASANIKEVSQSMASGSRTLPETMQSINEIATKLDRIMARLEKATERAPSMQREMEDALRELNQILDSLKKNFLIRPNLPPRPPSKVHVPELREVE